ncbi:hypothetical protein Tco_1165412 [Tanacetum coccineum]
MKMVPPEAFVCRCREENVVLRESYQPQTRGQLYYACPLSKKEERVRQLATSLRASTTLISSSGPSTPPSDSPGPSRYAKCSNCKLLIAKIKVIEATLEMYMYPENHTLDLTALLHELYNDMGKLGLE